MKARSLGSAQRPQSAHARGQRRIGDVEVPQHRPERPAPCFGIAGGRRLPAAPRGARTRASRVASGGGEGSGRRIRRGRRQQHQAAHAIRVRGRIERGHDPDVRMGDQVDAIAAEAAAHRLEVVHVVEHAAGAAAPGRSPDRRRRDCAGRRRAPDAAARRRPGRRRNTRRWARPPSASSPPAATARRRPSLVTSGGQSSPLDLLRRKAPALLGRHSATELSQRSSR